MEAFVASLAKHLLTAAKKLPRAQWPIVKGIINEIEEAVRDNPAAFVPTLQAALDECVMKLTSKEIRP